MKEANACEARGKFLIQGGTNVTMGGTQNFGDGVLTVSLTLALKLA